MWDSAISSSPHSKLVFSLVPFYLESIFRPKNFVLKMELFPKAEMLRMHTLTMHGVQSIDMPIADLIPITKYDYWCASWKVWCK